jgi:hypothetical protein
MPGPLFEELWKQRTPLLNFGNGGKSGGNSGNSGNSGDTGGDGLGYPPGPPPPGKVWFRDVDVYGDPIWNLSDSADQVYGSAGADHYGSDLQYKLGLKGIEVDWAQIGNDQKRIANEKAQVAINAKGQAETQRSNKAQEAAIARQRALDAASKAVDSYLKGTELADARRLAAFSEARQLLPFAVNKGQKYSAGFEAGGPLSQAMQGYGFKFQPREVVRQTFKPGELAQTPTSSQIGAGVIDRIGDVERAGAVGQRGVGS